MADKYHTETMAAIEAISFYPGLQASGNLETSTRSITAVAEADGVADADYSCQLTLPAPEDSRLRVVRIAARLGITLDSLSGANLYCRIYIDQQNDDHCLFDLAWNAAGELLSVTDVHNGENPVIFGLLRDGQSHTAYFFCWVDSGEAVISALEFWEGIGQGGPLYNQKCLELDHTGLISGGCPVNKVGTGSVYIRLGPAASVGNYIVNAGGGTAHLQVPYALVDSPALAVRSSVGTDLVYITSLYLVLRRPSV
jgi:hypothetical protein